MTPEEDIVKQLRAAFEAEPRIGVHQGTIHLAMLDGSLTIEGEVPTVAARRLALRLAQAAPGVSEVVDLLRVANKSQRGDDETATMLGQAMLAECDLRNCTLIHHDAAGDEPLHIAAGEDASGAIRYSVTDGVVRLEGHVISLSHRRVAEVLAWWTPGCRQVDNRLRVDPPEEDNDDEITDAVRLALELDPLVPADSVGITTRLGVVSLNGAVSSTHQRARAEHDAWCVPGVNEVVNRLAASA